MISEHVRITNEEAKITQKKLLESQLRILNTIRISDRYKDLREQELSLKILLKEKIEKLMSNLMILDRVLPKTAYKDELQIREPKSNARKSLEQEIDSIRKKLTDLQVP